MTGLKYGRVDENLAKGHCSRAIGSHVITLRSEKTGGPPDPHQVVLTCSQIHTLTRSCQSCIYVYRLPWRLLNLHLHCETTCTVGDRQPGNRSFPTYRFVNFRHSALTGAVQMKMKIYIPTSVRIFENLNTSVLCFDEICTSAFIYDDIIIQSSLWSLSQIPQLKALDARKFRYTIILTFPPRLSVNDHSGDNIDMHAPIRLIDDPIFPSARRYQVSPERSPAPPALLGLLLLLALLKTTRATLDPYHVTQHLSLRREGEVETVEPRLLDGLFIAEQDCATPDDGVHESRQSHHGAGDRHKGRAVFGHTKDGSDCDWRCAYREYKGIH